MSPRPRSGRKRFSAAAGYERLAHVWNDVAAQNAERAKDLRARYDRLAAQAVTPKNGGEKTPKRRKAPPSQPERKR